MPTSTFRKTGSLPEAIRLFDDALGTQTDCRWTAEETRITVADCDIERLSRDRQAVEPIELTHVDEFSTSLSKPGDKLKRRQCYL